MPGARTILHIDMDAFFASVEQLDDPALRGQPVLVGHDGARGVVAAASYEAREYGCHSAQPIVVAKRQCPHAIIVPGRRHRYHELSQQVFGIFEDITPLVEPLSIDEAFLDVTGSQRLLGPAPAIARMIRQRIQDETGLTASIGLAPNKYLAKLASEWNKPDGLTILDASEVPERLAPLPIRAMWGVGPTTERTMLQRGIRTFGDLHALTVEDAVRCLGSHGERYHRLAHGIDDRRVHPDHTAKSIGNEQTFGADLVDPDAVRAVLLGQSEHVATRVRRAGHEGRTVSIKIRFGDFETITRSESLDRPTARTDLVVGTARALFDRWAQERFRPVRLIGTTVSNLTPAGVAQLDLFVDPDDERQRRLDDATDAIRDRYGRSSIGLGVRAPDAADESTKFHTRQRPDT